MFERDYWETAMKDLPRPPMMPARCLWVQRGLQCNLCKDHSGDCVFAFTPEHDPYGASDVPSDTAVHVSYSNPRGPVPSHLADGGREIAKAQAELLSKYAAHCERKISTCSNVATLLEYTQRATLARDMSLIFFRAATLED